MINDNVISCRNLCFCVEETVIPDKQTEMILSQD